MRVSGFDGTLAMVISDVPKEEGLSNGSKADSDIQEQYTVGNQSYSTTISSEGEGNQHRERPIKKSNHRLHGGFS